MRKIDQCLNKLKGAILCLVMLQAVSCWDGLNDMFEEVAGVSAITFSQSSLTSGGMSINWTDPATVTGYDHILVTYTPGGSVTLSKGDTTFNVSGLSSSTEYTVTVQAIGKEGIIKAQSSFKVTPSGVYTLSFIYTAADLDSVRSYLGYYYVVMNDIDLSGYSNWDPIGSGSFFTGIMDCQNHSINNLTINRNEGILGLFEGVGVNGIVKNCIISGSITGTLSSSNIGGIAGWIINYGAIINCSSSVSITSTGGNSHLGGIAGNINNSGEIRNCSAKGTITLTNNSNDAGGIVGCCAASTNVVSSCYATGKVVASGSGSYTGGLAGVNYGTINNSYATGSVSGTFETGGLVGLNNNAGAKIINCYATGSVTGGTDIGGLVGSNTGGTCTTSYYDSQTTGQSDDTGKGVPRTTNQMKLIDTSVTTYSGWDFTTVWGISAGVNGGYPYLRDVAP